MDIFSSINEHFEIVSSGNKISAIDIESIANRGNISLPLGYLEILKTYGTPCLNHKKLRSPLIAFWDKAQIFDWMDTFYLFQEDIPQAFPFADDMGDYIFYYGIGKNGEGLYLVDGGAGNYREDAIKFSDSFESLFIEPQIFERLNRYYRFGA